MKFFMHANGSYTCLFDDNTSAVFTKSFPQGGDVFAVEWLGFILVGLAAAFVLLYLWRSRP